MSRSADAAPGQIVTDDRVDGVPMLVLANKRDAPGAASVELIKEAFNKHVVRLPHSQSRSFDAGPLQRLRRRRAVHLRPQRVRDTILRVADGRSEGIREAVQWLFLRVWSARQPRPPTQPSR